MDVMLSLFRLPIGAIPILAIDLVIRPRRRRNGHWHTLTPGNALGRIY